MNEFVSWENLSTFAGALTMVVILTQLTKNWGPLKNLDNQFTSYVYAVVILSLAALFTERFNASEVVLTLFNAAVVSLSANGGYDIIDRIINPYKDDGKLLITDTHDKTNYLLNIDHPLEELEHKQTVTLTIERAKESVNPEDIF